MVWERFESKLREDFKRFWRWFSLNAESTFLVIIIIVAFVLCYLKAQCIIELPSFGGSSHSVLGTIVQSLASIFAIVFSVSLVAVQLCSEELSHRLIGLYVTSSSFIFPFLLNLGSLILNWFLLAHLNFRYLLDYGIFLSFVAIFSLVPFFVYTIRFLMPIHVADLLLNRIKVKHILSENHADETLYQNKLQPIEDIISNRSRKGDYMTAKALISKIRRKMDDLLPIVNGVLTTEHEEDHIQLMTYMSEPFAKLLLGVAVSSNKADAIEITFNIINNVAGFVKKFWEARFAPAFMIFDGTFERIFSQAKCRFKPEEYESDLAQLRVLISSARAGFSSLIR